MTIDNLSLVAYLPIGRRTLRNSKSSAKPTNLLDINCMQTKKDSFIRRLADSQCRVILISSFVIGIIADNHKRHLQSSKHFFIEMNAQCYTYFDIAQ